MMEIDIYTAHLIKAQDVFLPLQVIKKKNKNYKN